MEYYNCDIDGRIEALPILTIGENLRIAFFNLHGNQELTEYCGKKLAQRLKDVDVIITAESKGLQLAHVVARELGHKLYAVARKSQKLYMQDGIKTSSNSITKGFPVVGSILNLSHVSFFNINKYTSWQNFDFI